MTSVPTPTGEPPGAAARTRRTRFIVATLAGLLAGISLFVFFGDDREPSGGGDPATDSLTGPGGPSAEPEAVKGSAPAPTVTELSLGDDSTRKCMVPKVDILKQQSVAFEGTVNTIEADTVSLDVKTWFRGEPTDQVILQTADPQLRLALSGVDFEVGPTYLVSANEGRVTMCGFSGEATPDLSRLFAAAFES